MCETYKVEVIIGWHLIHISFRGCASEAGTDGTVVVGRSGGRGCGGAINTGICAFLFLWIRIWFLFKPIPGRYKTRNKNLMCR